MTVEPCKCLSCGWRGLVNFSPMVLVTCPNCGAPRTKLLKAPPPEKQNPFEKWKHLG